MSKVYFLISLLLVPTRFLIAQDKLPACAGPYAKVGNGALDFNHYRLIRPMLKSAVEYIEQTGSPDRPGPNPQFVSSDTELTIFAYEIFLKYVKNTFPKNILKKALAKDDDWTNFIKRHPIYYRRVLEELVKGYHGPFCPEGRKPFNKNEIIRAVGLNLHLTIDLPPGVTASRMMKH